ncbi:MAG: amino acid ABC transporter permease [Beijerinckiaceae bacterium]
MELLYEYRVFLLAGLWQTLLMSGVVALGGTLCSIILVTGMSAGAALIRKPAYALTEILRDVPLMVTVLLTYFVAPKIGLQLDPFWATCLAVSVWGGANGAQIIRAGLLSVSKEQRETARSFGLDSWKGLALVVLPQAMPVIIPPFVGLLTALMQATSLGAVVGAHELLRSGQILIEQTTISRGGTPAYLVYGSILVIYFALSWSISLIGRRIEAHFLKPYRIHASDAAPQRLLATETRIQTSA